ncbi:eukaryotic translation initiation factor 3 subunit [Culex quinquefasciatus]|uniref:Eukaryotic translation initiation factor 3 subunit n=1 Tax=Culex quinquefasciatus TaxID=7176 RepID=B0W2R5_CULQU|nr:eukaryotic translation initiation factor 3 subunit [Culex quinquefasciatus]|eukprot:XP_001842999.1 eukaryotic translation initiation factor 3 subunit [Culex quinquefasciatus]
MDSMDEEEIPSLIKNQLHHYEGGGGEPSTNSGSACPYSLRSSTSTSQGSPSSLFAGSSKGSGSLAAKKKSSLLIGSGAVLQKKMNDIYSNGKLTTGLPPIHIQPPSMGSVLDMLNAINGIIFVQISSKEIANLKNEIEKRQKEDGAAGETSVAQANQEEVDRLLTETTAGIPFEEQDKYEQW